MSIVTRTGDQGTTGLMYNRRVPKSDPQVEAYGSVDELNAALGWARTQARRDFIPERLLAIQKQLVLLMGELATRPEDLDRYQRDGFQCVDGAFPNQMDAWVEEIERLKPSYDGWATPGANPGAASLDLARTACRRAERRVQAWMSTVGFINAHILVYLNRLSDLLWLYARWTETQVLNSES